MIEIKTPDQFTDFLNQEFIFPDLIQFNQADLESFLALSQDQTDIHDPRLHDNPIIPGNMILMMIPRYLQQMIQVEKLQSVITVGYDKVSFKIPLHLDQQFKLSLTCTNSRKMSDGYLLSQSVKLIDPTENKVLTQIQVNDFYR